VAKLFWWFNQGADVDLSLTPKPHYGCDGSKAFDITGTPDNLSAEVKGMLGPFPFPAFWGPMAGALSSRWIARSAAHVLDRHRPDLTLVYLPHLDYDPQRFGPSGCDMARQVAELDDACAPILETAERTGARVWVVSEYGHVDVDRPVEINRHLRREGLFVVRDGPFGEMLDTFASRAIAVCDHQLAHVYVRQKNDVLRVADGIRSLAGVARAELNLDHPRSGEIIALSDPRSWFAYPYWLDDARAPDFARTVDIHRKPGFDPCEMFFDPTLRFPKARVARRLIAKKLGFRATLDVIPLDTGLVKGSHGLAADDPLDRPLLIADGPAPTTASITFREVYERLLTFDTA
jgi:predicted AlkP superfamily pyrophosphatase or phosphodiesterase